MRARTPRRSTTQRGYGSRHKAIRRALIAAYVRGVTTCCRCGLPMTDPPRLVHLDHTDDKTGYLGLAHRRCNVAAAHTGQRAPSGRPY